MALKVVGSGLGRTGTMSLKLALEQLGFGPCHHMVEVFMHPETVPLWIEAGHGPGNWDKIFDGYQSMVDYPGARFWRELADHYPDAKVLHSVRDPDRWFESTQETIFASGSAVDGGPGPMRAFFDVVSEGIAGHLHDRDFMIDHFHRHTEAVKAAIAPERLLVFEVKQGWEPLCAFLEVPIPDTPFPRENTREEFKARVAGGPPGGGPPDPERIRQMMEEAKGRH